MDRMNLWHTGHTYVKRTRRKGVRFARFSVAHRHRRMCMCASAARDRELCEYVTTCLVESDRECAFVQCTKCKLIYLSG